MTSTQMFSIGTSPKPPTSSSSDRLKSLLIVIIGFLILIVAFGTAYYVGTRDDQQVIINKHFSKALKPTSPPDPTTNWQTLNMSGCSTKATNFGYTLKVPPSWTSSSKQESLYQTKYKISLDENTYISLTCDTAGIGSVICVDGQTDNPFSYKTGANGCYPANETENAQYTLDNPHGSFVFYAHGLKKSALDQILSTFQFTDTETCGQMSYTDAFKIAQASTCAQQGTLQDNHSCNPNSNTWWIDFVPNEPKSGCNPACVVDTTTKTAEINWRCTGLIQP